MKYAVFTVCMPEYSLEEGIEKSEDKLDLIYTLARFYSAQGNEQKAEALIERATEAQPDQARPYLILSAYRDRNGDLDGALAAARKAVEVQPDDETARLREAEVVIEIGQNGWQTGLLSCLMKTFQKNKRRTSKRFRTRLRRC